MNIAALIIAASLLASRVLGVLREMLLARTAGVTLEKNALDLAFLIPDILNHVISTGFLSIVFIPVFTGYLVRGEQDRAWRFFSNTLNIMAIALAVLMVPAFIWMPELIQMFTASTPPPELLERATYFGRIILPGQLFFLIGTFLVAVQHTRKQFLLPSLTGVIYNLSIVVGGWLFREQGVAGFAWGVPAGAFIGFFVLQMIGVRRDGIHYAWVMDPREGDFHKALKLMLPMMLGVGSMFALEFVIRSFGSGFGMHGISTLNYAYRLMYTLVAVFGFSVGVAGYPDMARLAKEGLHAEIGRKVWASIARMSAVLVPAVIVLWVLAFPAVRLLFERGAFDRESSEQVAQLLAWYLPVSLGLCGQAVLVRAFYAQERMWRPTLISTGIFILTLPAYHLWADRLGIRSVPLVGALGATAQFAMLALAWVRLNGTAGMVQILRDMLIAGAVLLLGIGGAWCWESLAAEWVRSVSWPWLLGYSVLTAFLLGSFTLALQGVLGSRSARDLGTRIIGRVRRKKENAC